MNERILELAEQAAQEVRVEYNNPYWRMQNEIKEDAAWKEKFAELIVRECINNVLDSTMEYCGRSQIAEELREHFGVES